MFELTVKNREEKVSLKNISSLRQAFVAASTLILVGVVGSIYVHPYFIALPLLVAGGLMFSGLVGWCPMAAVMEKLFSGKE